MYQTLALLGSRAAMAVVILLAYLGIAMIVALFSKNKDRADRAKEIFRDLIGLFSRRQ